MPTVITTQSAPVDFLTRVRRLLDEAFEDDFNEEGWQNTLGGWHVVIEEAADVIAHAAVVPRAIQIAGRPFRTGYVEGVATAPRRQGEGLGSLVMSRLNRLVRGEFDLGALSTGRHTFYERLGWERWRGPTFVRDGDAMVRTKEDDDGVMVLRFGSSVGVDLTAPISCEARTGDDW